MHQPAGDDQRICYAKCPDEHKKYRHVTILSFTRAVSDLLAVNVEVGVFDCGCISQPEFEFYREGGEKLPENQWPAEDSPELAQASLLAEKVGSLATVLGAITAARSTVGAVGVVVQGIKPPSTDRLN